MPKHRGRKNPVPKKVHRRSIIAQDEQDIAQEDGEPMDVAGDFPEDLSGISQESEDGPLDLRKSVVQQSTNIVQESANISPQSTNLAQDLGTLFAQYKPSRPVKDGTDLTRILQDALKQRSDSESQDWSSVLPSSHLEIMELLGQMPPESLYKENDVEIINAAQTQVEDNKYVCPKCGKEYTSIGGMRYHINIACPNHTNNKFSCLVCLENFRRPKDVLQHIALEHMPTGVSYSTRRTAKTSTVSYSDDTAMPDNPPPMEEDDYVPADTEVTPSPKTPKSAKKLRATSSGDKSSFATLERPLDEVMPWLHKLLQKLQKQFKKLLPDIKCNELVLDPDFLNSNFSVSKRSPPFIINRENNSNLKTECEGLNPFSSTEPIEGCHDLTFNVGGPVWALSWCPENLNRVNTNQFLALSTHTMLHKYDTTYSEPGMIQIWNCGVLGVHGHRNDTPMFAYGLTTNEAPIWDLKWCPIGGRIESKPELIKTRLGILAAACASGKVLVLAIPEPDVDDIQANMSSSVAGLDGARSKTTFYKADPSMVLMPGFGDQDKLDSLFGQCLCVDWSIYDGAEWIAGGFSKGIVALWKIKEPSSLLFSQGSNHGPSTLVACKTFHAHIKPIKSICWCPCDTMLATAGLDRMLKFWNRDYTEAPVMESKTKASTYSEIVWPILWCGVYAATDEVFAAPQCHGVAFHCLTTRMPYLTIPFKSMCWSVSGSDWMNCVVGGDATGQPVVNACSNWSRKIKLPKGFPRIALFSTDVEWDTHSLDNALNTSENGREADDSQNGVSTSTQIALRGLTENGVRGESEHDSVPLLDSNHLSTASSGQMNIDDSEVHSYKLIFHDTDMKNLQNIEKRKCHTKARIYEAFPSTNCSKPLVASINKVSWNPNFGSHTWIASGMQCGLVRLHCVDKMHSDKMGLIYGTLGD